MPFPITGADAGDRGPSGCVVRFMQAGAAGDSDAASAELHPDHREGLSGGVHAPPGIVQAEVLPAEPGDGFQLVPTRLVGADGSEQRFVFLVRPAGDGWGIDLEGSLHATFGGDPLQMMQDALTTAVAPLGEAMSQMGEALGQALGGGGSGDAATARRIGAGESAPAASARLPAELAARVTELDLRRRVQQPDPEAPAEASSELAVRCAFALDPAWTALACTGVAITAATSCEGEALIPVDASEDLGAEQYASWERERRDCYARIPLAAPAGAFTGLAALSGVVRLALVGGDLLEIDLGPVADLLGRRTDLAALRLTLEAQREDDGQLTLRMPYGGFDRLEEVVPVGADGEALNQSWSGSGDGETSTRTYGSEIPDDAHLRLRFWSCREDAELPFAVLGLPLRLA